MNKNIYIGILTGLALGATVTSPSFAAVSCYGPLDQDPKALGEILPCFLEQIWSFFQMIFVAAALIMGMFLVYKTFTNRENPKVLEELPMKWGYLVIFTLLAFGAGGTILNFTFKLFGFGDLNSWITPLNEIFAKWTQRAQGF